MNEFVLEKEANRFRQEHGLSSTDPIRLKSLLQQLQVVTIFSGLSADFSGMALKVTEADTVMRFMLVNSNQSVGKQHFTICHELYHLFIQNDFVSRVCQTGRYDKKDYVEYNADLFASYLLLPYDGIVKFIPDEELNQKNVSLASILNLEHYYSCSRSALLYRLKKMKFITSDEYDRYSTGVQRSAAEYGFQTDLYKPGNSGTIIGDYGMLAKNLYDTDKISQSHYYSLLTDLGIDLTQVEEHNYEEL